MLDNDDTPEEIPAGGFGRPDRLMPPSVEARLACIRERLEREVPQGIFVPDSWLAKQLHMSTKTLRNRRADDKLRYPKPMHPGGCRIGLHPRPDLIEWLALEELRHVLGPGFR